MISINICTPPKLSLINLPDCNKIQPCIFNLVLSESFYFSLFYVFPYTPYSLYLTILLSDRYHLTISKHVSLQHNNQWLLSNILLDPTFPLSQSLSLNWCLP
uniref:Uncharacterized protein n=1 Tax=Cacopsylla melanoneura TaxID=428564 RepID=A0A8D8VF31_9HEMI